MSKGEQETTGYYDTNASFHQAINVLKAQGFRQVWAAVDVGDTEKPLVRPSALITRNYTAILGISMT